MLSKWKLAMLFAGLASFLSGCAGTNGETLEPSAEPEADAGESEPESVAPRFEAYLTGRFSSEQQANTNPAYFPISLAVCDAEVPELGERVLYVEQAFVGESPYRQRVYVVEDGETPSETAVSYVYAFTDPSRFVGFCDTGSNLGVTEGDVTLREGCEVQVTYDADTETFTGGTEGTDCESSLNGAAYATSAVTLSANQMESWDQGFDAAGDQVWGATAGPYVFDRLPVEE